MTPKYTMLLIITWLWCFFPGFDRFIPGFDRFIPGFDRFIPASIPDTGTLPPTIKNISSKKMYFLNLISSFFISLIWNNTIKKYSAMPRMHIFLKNTVNTNPNLFRAQFNATGCRLWITACDRSLQNVVNVTQKTLFWIDCLQMSRIRYVLKYIHRRGWSHSTETHFTSMKSTGSCLFTWETSHLKFAHERCVTSSRGNSRLDND